MKNYYFLLWKYYKKWKLLVKIATKHNNTIHFFLLNTCQNFYHVFLLPPNEKKIFETLSLTTITHWPLLMSIISIFNLYLPKNECLFQRAIEEGVDFIETNISSSKDGVLICFHDVVLDVITNFSNHRVNKS